jgi:hypothetical protein
VTAAEQVPPVDLRTRIAAAFEAEDARNWGYDHEFEADDFETLAFADVAIAVMAGEERPLAAADEDRDRLAAELAAARAEVERLRADRNRMHLALAQERHERAEAAEWPDVEQADRSVTVEIVPDPGGLLTALRATTGTRDASRAPESPAGAATPRSSAVDAPTKGVSGPRSDR